MNIGYNENGID
jgi:hypothetical protein